MPNPHIERLFHAATRKLCDRSAPKLQADVYKTLEELVPLQVNVQAVASREVRGIGAMLRREFLNF